jgi:hypothetical protein
MYGGVSNVIKFDTCKRRFPGGPNTISRLNGMDASWHGYSMTMDMHQPGPEYYFVRCLRCTGKLYAFRGRHTTNGPVIPISTFWSSTRLVNQHLDTSCGGWGFFLVSSYHIGCLSPFAFIRWYREMFRSYTTSTLSPNLKISKGSLSGPTKLWHTM